MYGFIYITTNNINNKKYIGQKTYNCNNWENYLGSGKYLKRAIKKYGEENFSREIIDEANTKEELDEKEIFWIGYYDAVNSNDFYNIAFGGDGGNTLAGYTEEQKSDLSSKLSDMRKGKVNIGSSNGSARKVICLNTMQIFDSIIEASKQTGISKNAIQQCCSPKSKCVSAGEINGERSVWKYYNENESYEYIPYKREYKTPIFPVYCITTNEWFDNARIAGEKYNVNPSSISSCCRGKLNSAGKLNGQPLKWTTNI